MNHPKSQVLLLIALVLFVISALIDTGAGFVNPPPNTGRWIWSNWIFGWAMVFFAASFYQF